MIVVNNKCSAEHNTKKINKLLTQRRKVELPEGDIYISGPLKLKLNGNWLTGNGPGTRLILNELSNPSNFIHVTSDRCKVTDLMIIGNREYVNYNPAKLRGCGIVVYKAYRTYIENVFVHDVSMDGIHSRGSNDLKASLTTISNCVIERAGKHSIYHNKYSQDRIIFNTFTQDAKSDGLMLDGNYGSVITNSHFYRNDDNNVKIIGGGRHRFENCTLDKAQNWGVYLAYTDDITMSKCIIFDNNQGERDAGGVCFAENVYRCLLMQNTIYDDPPVTQNYGIFIRNSCTNNNIVFNEVRNSINENYKVENDLNLILYGNGNVLKQVNKD